MASSTANLALARTQSLRARPTAGLKLSSAPTPPTGPGPSNIALFLTNLRLLDLDLRKDWPDITLAVWTSKDVKKRIQCVEWALYQLFVLWDPEEARNKLQPFFPPLEPLQSLNLRAALYRCLDQAKKNGVLGRDTVLRKTMLDECKGDRLEEILAVISNAVLEKKVQEATSGPYQAIAQQLASENFSYSGERTILTALILAHKASLSKHLQEKSASRAKYRDFSELLNLNHRRATRRHEQLKESIEQRGSQTEISRREIGDLHEKFQKNWSGNSEWSESILYGDCTDSRDGLLASRFEIVWESVEKGKIGEMEEKKHVGLLEQLETRVKDQADRLARWQAFGKTLSRKDTSPKKKEQPVSKESKKIDLGFTVHQALQVRGKAAEAAEAPPLLDDYARLLQNMKDELENVGKPQPRKPRSARESLPLQSRRKSTLLSPQIAKAESPVKEEEWSSSSDSEEQSPGFNSYKTKSLSRTPPSEAAQDITAITAPDTALAREKTIVPISDLDTDLDSEDSETIDAASTPRQKTLRRSPPNTTLETENTIMPISDLDTELEDEDDRTIHAIPTPQKTQPTMRSQKSPPALRPNSIPSLDPDNELLADQILKSMAATSPSPKKPRHTLSLAERTRLSMARASHSEYDDFDLEDLPRLSLKPKATSPLKSPTGELDPHADLIERTRKSMAGFEAAQKKAQLERRRSVKAAAAAAKKPRASNYFPKVTEEEAAAAAAAVPDLDHSVLIDGDPDYEDVFKSRPKIATSPAVSPAISPVRVWTGDEGSEE